MGYTQLAAREAWGSSDELRLGRARRTRLDAEVRHDLVHRVRREIASGTYEGDEKIDAAIDRLIHDL
jgi:hypothetical protein